MLQLGLLFVFLAYLKCQVLAQCWKNVTCSSITTPAFPGLWESNIYSPSSRNVPPRHVLSWPGLIQQSYSSSVRLSGNGSLVTYDFGIEVGGIISFDYASTGIGMLGIAFTEGKNFVGEWSDSSNGRFAGPDGALYTSFNGSSANTTYVMPQERLRGGFRYLTIFLETNSSASASLRNVNVELDFQPTWSNLRSYQGYFHSSDELLNRIWYAGAYTLQSNCVPTNTGRQVPFLTTGWANNATLGPGDTIIVDGAKRDRAVWPGDMGVAVPSTFVSLGDLDSVKNALQVMYDHQAVIGAFDESGPPLSQRGSDTYHMWTMIGTYNYFLYSNDTAFLESNWAKYRLAMSYITAKVDNSSLLNVTGIRDWARWQQGFHNTEANIILYRTLTTGSQLASWLSDSSLSRIWTAEASSLRSAINSKTWDNSTGSYRDNDTLTTLHPQDANSLSLLYSIPTSNSTNNSTSGSFFSKVQSIATALLENWTPIGPETPELPYNISPFISSFELLGRLTQRDTSRALELLRTTWGWIINNPNSTESTLLEGYLTNGSFSYRSNRGYAYDPSYPSHAHGWSSGPTSALTNFILGLDVVEPAGSNWTLAPQPGDLTYAEGGFTTILGKFSAKWTTQTTAANNNNNNNSSLDLSWNTPTGTSGIVTVPMAKVLGQSGGGIVNVVNNGKPIDISQGTTTGLSLSVSPFGESLISIAVSGGTGRVTVS